MAISAHLIPVSDLKKIITLASLAPSGENAQPWQFKIIDNKIYQYLVPERDQSAYNFNQYASYVANGAALENIEIASRAMGYNATIETLPNATDHNLIAIVTLEKSQPQNEPLYEFIEKRITNRKPYKKEPLTAEQKKALLSQKVSEAEFLLNDDLINIQTLADVGATNEYIMLNNQSIHNFFFSHVNWTEAEENEKRYGFYIKTLELLPPAQFMFKVFSKWNRMRIFKALGFPKMVLKQNAQIYASSGAMAAITITNTTPRDFINAGRLTQRVWLIVTKLGLSMQPMTGILFFMLRLRGGDTTAFSPTQQELIKTQYKKVETIFQVSDNKTITMMFRIGNGEAPSAQSSKYSLGKVLVS